MQTCETLRLCACNTSDLNRSLIAVIPETTLYVVNVCVFNVGVLHALVGSPLCKPIVACIDIAYGDES